MEAIIGISLGIIIIVGIQAACYRFVDWENYHKAVIIATVSAFLGVAAILFIVKIFGG